MSAPESVGMLLGRIARSHADTTAQITQMAETLQWIVGASDLTSEINQRARASLHALKQEKSA